MKHKTGKMIMGATLSLAAIVIAVDHTQHRLPDVEKVSDDTLKGLLQKGTPCGLGDVAPCSLDGSEAPCSLGGGDEVPCSLGGGGRFNDL